MIYKISKDRVVVGAIITSTKNIAEEIFLAATGLGRDFFSKGWERILSGNSPESLDILGDYTLEEFRPMDRYGSYQDGKEENLPPEIPIFREGETTKPLPPLPEERVEECKNGYVLHIRFAKSFLFLGEGPRYSVEYYFTGNEEKPEYSDFFSSSSTNKGLPRKDAPEKLELTSLSILEQSIEKLKGAAADVTFLDVKPMSDVLPQDITFSKGFDKGLLSGKSEWGEVKDGLAFDSSGSLESTVVGWTEESILVLLTYEEYHDWDVTDTVNVLVKYPRNPS